MKIVKDKFNSEIFQIQMANLFFEPEETVNENEFVQAELQAKDAGCQHITVKVPSYAKDILNLAVKSGFHIADTLIQYMFDFKRSKLAETEDKCILRDCREQDVEALKQISRTAFVIDRFHSDEHLDNRLCDRYYEKWIENSYYGFAERVIVAEYNQEPVGFTTGKTYAEDLYGHLVLSAVSNKYRGIGIYTSMIHEGITWMLREHSELKGVIVGTQLDNIAVQKAWIKLGFTVYDSSYVLQKYIGE